MNLIFHALDRKARLLLRVTWLYRQSNTVIDMDGVFLQEFRCIKEISVPPWQIKRCTLVKRNLLGNGDYPHSVCVCISQANPHPPVDIFPKKDTVRYMPYLLFFNVFAGGGHCVCVFVGSVLLLWRSVESPDTVNNNVVPFCLPLFIKPFIASWFWIQENGGKKTYLPSDLSLVLWVCAFISMGESELWY